MWLYVTTHLQPKSCHFRQCRGNTQVNATSKHIFKNLHKLASQAICWELASAVSVLHDKTLFRHHYQDHPLAKYHDMGIWLQILPYYFILVGGLKACWVVTHLNSSSNDLLTFHPKKKCCIVKHISLQDSRFLSWTGWDNQCQRWSALCSAFRSFTFSASWKYHVQDNVSNCQVEINTTWKQLSELAGRTFQGLYINSLLCILFQPLLKDCREKLHKNMQGEWKNCCNSSVQKLHYHNKYNCSHKLRNITLKVSDHHLH
jgi:hypothetical protein